MATDERGYITVDDQLLPTEGQSVETRPPGTDGSGDDPSGDGTSAPSGTAALAAVAPGLRPGVQALLDSIDPAASLNRVEIWDITPFSTWAKGRVAILGDAAHNTAPDIGQGACSALEDAFALGIAADAHLLHQLVDEGALRVAGLAVAVYGEAPVLFDHDVQQWPRQRGQQHQPHQQRQRQAQNSGAISLMGWKLVCQDGDEHEIVYPQHHLEDDEGEQTRQY